MRTSSALALAAAASLTGNLARLPLGGQEGKAAPLLLSDAGVMLAVAACAVAVLARGRLRVDAAGRWGLAFAAVGFIAALRAAIVFGLGPGEVAFALAYLARWTAYFALFLMAAELLDRPGAGRVAAAVELAIIAFAAFGITQSLFLPGFAQLVYPDSVVFADWDPQGRRLVSTFLDPNFAGALLVLGLLLYGGRVAAGDRVPAWRPLLVAVALLLTLSRSSFLALLVGGAVLVAGRGLSRRAARLTLAAAVLAVPFVPLLARFAESFNKLSLDASALARLVTWARALRVFADNPTLGIGFNTYGFVQARYGWHVSGAATFGLDGGLLFVAVLTGVVGVALFALMLLAILRRGWRARGLAALTARERGLALGGAAMVPALVVHSLFVNSLLLPVLLVPLWLSWGATAAVAREAA